jgi:hypothetical protein
VATKAGVIKVASDTKGAFWDASAPLAGSVPKQEGNNEKMISCEEAVQQLAEGAFADLFSYPENNENSGKSLTSHNSKDLSAGKLFSKGQVCKQVLAHNVKMVNFSTDGATVRMILTLESNGKTNTVICSAIRHSG